MIAVHPTRICFIISRDHVWPEHRNTQINLRAPVYQYDLYSICIKWFGWCGDSYITKKISARSVARGTDDVLTGGCQGGVERECMVARDWALGTEINMYMHLFWSCSMVHWSGRWSMVQTGKLKENKYSYNMCFYHSSFDPSSIRFWYRN